MQRAAVYHIIFIPRFSKTVCTPSHDKTSPLSALISSEIVYGRRRSCHPRKPNRRADCVIKREATSSPKSSLESVRRHVPPSKHPAVSRGTIQR
ncbi:hypothetical protein TNCV_30961 [Trichonephila clavipes]|nr:hypothetical protein TNCV_30961 [Trichonephila clavipes]